MSTSVPTAGGLVFTISMQPEDAARFEGIQRRNKKSEVNHNLLRQFLAEKAMRQILSAYHGVQPEDLPGVLEEVEAKAHLHGPNKRRPYRVLEIEYRFTRPRAKGKYRHAFRVEPIGTGLSGRYVTISRKP